MGDKNPKTLGKNKKQKESDKAKANKKAQDSIDAKKKINNPKK